MFFFFRFLLYRIALKFSSYQTFGSDYMHKASFIDTKNILIGLFLTDEIMKE